MHRVYVCHLFSFVFLSSLCFVGSIPFSAPIASDPTNPPSPLLSILSLFRVSFALSETLRSSDVKFRAWIEMISFPFLPNAKRSTSCSSATTTTISTIFISHTHKNNNNLFTPIVCYFSCLVLRCVLSRILHLVLGVNIFHSMLLPYLCIVCELYLSLTSHHPLPPTITSHHPTVVLTLWSGRRHHLVLIFHWTPMVLKQNKTAFGKRTNSTFSTFRIYVFECQSSSSFLHASACPFLQRRTDNGTLHGWVRQ